MRLRGERKRESQGTLETANDHRTHVLYRRFDSRFVGGGFCGAGADRKTEGWIEEEQGLMMPVRRGNNTIVRLIGAFKLLKGLLLLTLAVGVLKLINQDADAKLAHWIEMVRVDPGNHYIHGLLTKVARMDDHKLEAISAGSFFYSALMLTEGIGLFLRKRWAEYFTIIATGSFIPLEVYELVQKVSVVKVIVLVINLMIVVYLILRVGRKGEVE